MASTIAPPPYNTPFLDWSDQRIDAIDNRQSFYAKKGNNGPTGGASNNLPGFGGTLVSQPWLLWFNSLIGGIDGSSGGGGGSSLLRFRAGLLSALPHDLGPNDAGQQLYYAEDYDHLYVWNGTSWVCMNYDAGKVTMFAFPPGTPGWWFCDGVGTVPLSMPDGSTIDVQVPDLVSNGGVYPKLGGAYDGPIPTDETSAALIGVPGGSVDPFTPAGTISSTTAGGTVSGNMPDHVHVASNTATSGAKDIGGHDWGVITSGSAHILDIVIGGGGPTGITGSATLGGSANMPAHQHTLTSITGVATGTENSPHEHDFFDAVDFGTSSLAFIPSTGGPMQVVTSLGGSVNNTTDSENAGHDHNIDLSGNVTDIEFGSPIALDLSGVTLDTSGLSVDTSGITATVGDVLVPHYHILDSESGAVKSDPVAMTMVFSGSSHGHTFTGTPVTPTFSGTPVTPVFTGTPVTPVFTGSSHGHTFTGSLATPNFTGDIGTLALDGAGEARHLTLIPMLRL